MPGDRVEALKMVRAPRHRQGPQGRSVARLMSGWLLLILFAGWLPLPNCEVAAGGGQKAARSRRKRPKDEAIKQPSEPVPYSLEIFLKGPHNPQNETTLTLAVGTITVVHCPEPPRSVLLGIRNGTGISQFVGGPRRSDLYIRALKGGITTSITIELPSAIFGFGLRTVAVRGGAKVGDYHGEVTVRLPGYREETVKLKSQVAELEQRVREMHETARRLEAEAEARERRAREEAVRQALAENLAVVERLSDQPPRKRRPVSQQKVRVTQVGRAVRDRSGRWWGVFTFENRGKTPVTIEDVRSVDGATVRFTGSGRQIAARSKLQLALLIESSATLPAPPDLTFIISGLSLNVPLEY